MISQYVKGRVFVFIDAANLESSLKYLGWWFDYLKLHQYLAKNTQLGQIRYYCVSHNTENQNNFFAFLKRNGYKLVTKPMKIVDCKDGVYKRKANFDVEIAVDAINFKNNYNTLVLFSGDSDFKYLIELLKKEGKKIEVISTRYHVSKELIQSAYFIDLKNLRGIFQREK